MIRNLISRRIPSAVASATAGSCIPLTPTRLKTSQTCYHRNQQYSIVGLTNATGTLVERYTYSAYGTLGIYAANGTARSSSTYANRYTYTGREWDVELRLYHFRARWYDPATGGFVSRDLLGYVDGMSLYRGYFGVRGVDHTGYCQEESSVGCCCCAESLRIDSTKNKDVFNEPATGLAGWGTEFSVEIVTKWITSNNPEQSYPCWIEWNEALELPLRWPPSVVDQVKRDVKEVFNKDIEVQPQVSKKWYNQHTEFWYLAMFKPWRNQDLKSLATRCDGSPNTVVIVDTPGRWGAQFGRQVIQFEIVVNSGVDCGCAVPSIRLCFEYWVRKARNKAPEWRIRSIPCGKREKLPYYGDFNDPDAGFQPLDPIAQK